MFNKEFFLGLLSRSAPALSGSLITYGVSANHAETIVLGGIALIYTAVELWEKNRKAQ